MAYAVLFVPAAARQLQKLDPGAQRRIRLAIDGLAKSPRPPGYKKLSTTADAYRLRVSDYRILYEITDRKLLVLENDPAKFVSDVIGEELASSV